MNTYGNIFRLTEFGESHGPALGGVIDGMPSGIEIDLDRIQHQLDRRRPGQSTIVTARDEKDRVEIPTILIRKSMEYVIIEVVADPRLARL